MDLRFLVYRTKKSNFEEAHGELVEVEAIGAVDGSSAVDAR